MKIRELLEGRDAPLYHATNPNAASRIIEQDAIIGVSTHNGRVPDVYKAVKGISLTRDIRFAKNWGPVVFILDQTKLTRHHKMMPVDFFVNHTFDDGVYRRRGENAEAEEFVLGDIDPLSKYLIRIELQKATIPALTKKIDGWPDEIQPSRKYEPLLNHPLLKII